MHTGVSIIDYNSIDRHWQEEWDRAKIFEANLSDKPPFMVTAAFPYVNAPHHIGHLRTYGTADLLARYKRMRGFNVLFPMGFHGTGTPILAFAKRIRENDAELINEFKIFHIPEEEIRKMTDPEYIVEYFAKEVENGMRRTGLSIDWRRKLVSIEPIFSKFIEWQFKVLDENGLLVRGDHPVGWCTNENNAVGSHDTRHDMEPEIEEQTAIKFKVEGEDASLACSTYRPETLFGVTNLFVKDPAIYALCTVNGEKVYLAKEAAKILKSQMDLEIQSEIPSSEILKKRCVNPLTGEAVPVLPGFFVRESMGTGIVMSVPAHAPFDYAAIQRLEQSGYPVHALPPKKVIDVQIGRSLSDVSEGEAKPSQTEVPSLAYLEILHTGPNAINDMLEFATKLQYREESHWGKMAVKGYEGMGEPEARERITKLLIDGNEAFKIYIIGNAPVVCRCGTEAIVKIIKGQWFLNYGDEKWKSAAREVFAKMDVKPDKLRKTFEAAIGWLNLRAVARAQGLGTKFPLDRNFMIESLSDSTIYMALYTFIHHIRGVDANKLIPEFFDYVLLGKGDAEAVSKATGIEYETVNRARESFSYWYRETSRHSGADLVFNHLTMYIFNHSIIFGKEYWPKHMVVNGSVLSEGEKMSKSLGNIIPLEEGIERYGADPIRIAVIAGADLYSDSEFSAAAVNGIKERIEYLNGIIDGIDNYQTSELKKVDYYLYSVLNRKVDSATRHMESLELRDASTEILYNSVIELKRYFKRGGANGIVIKDFVQSVVLMLQPFAPHVAEELWHNLGNGTLASLERWPALNKELIDEKAERLDNLVDEACEDIKRSLSLMAKKGNRAPKEIRLIVASDWKRDAANRLAETRKASDVIDAVSSGNGGVGKEKIADYVAKIAKRLNEVRRIDISQEEEFSSLKEAEDYIAKECGAKASVEKEGESDSQRADRSAPMKPSIEIRF